VLNNILRLKSRRISHRSVEHLPLHELSLTRAKALGICADPANDTDPECPRCGHR